MGSEKGRASGAAANGADTPDTKCHVGHENSIPVSAAKGAPKATPKTKKGGSLLAQVKLLRQLSKRPVPTAYGDGRYPQTVVRPKLRDDLSRIGITDIKTLVEMIHGKLRGNGITDDKTMIMERVIALVADLPHQSMLREKLTNTLLNELWYSLEHPPLLYIGNEFKYRTADGSNNNPILPTLGAAGSNYARSCRPGHVPLGALPDPELVFEGVMARQQYRKHPNNVSSILWYWASIVIHDLFWTDYRDPSKSKTSSYLDLSPLYGSNQQMQDSIRTFKDGKLKVDSYADKRLIGMPPGVSVLLIMFNRFHNQVAEKLALVNEGGRFTKPKDDSPAAWKKYDEELFQTARLVTGGLYINIMLVDYVRNIVNLNRVDTTWTLDPRQEMGVNVGTKDGAERGTGNIVSAEFNLCYRWHACISDKDDKWIQEFYGSIFGDRAETMTSIEMIHEFVKFEATIPEDPAERTFGGFERGKDGKFSDDDLVACIASAIEDCAGAFGARNVPRVMKPIEILGILQGRRWNVAGLNEFRKQFGLKPYETFEDINPDEDVADHLRHLYQHPDNVELYPGLVAEDAKKPMVPGVGITPTYTISRVVLSDAVCLVRGDRFHTIDYNPRSLSNWGYREAEYDLNVNHGCVFYKLFLRAFPNHFKANSVYAHYPMVIPSENAKILKNLKRDHLFDWDAPTYVPERVNVATYGGAKYIIDNQDKYRVAWGENLTAVFGEGGSSFLRGGEPALQVKDSQLYLPTWKSDVKAFYATVTEKLLAQKSYKMAGRKQVDLVRDVGNFSHVHFVSRVFALPLKSADNPRGALTEQELYEALSTMFWAAFHDHDKVRSFPLLQSARAAADKVGGIIEGNVKLARLGLAGSFVRKGAKSDALSGYGVNMIKALAKAGLSSNEIAWSRILPTAAAMVPSQAEVFAHAVDFYLSDAGKPYLPDLNRAACLPSSEESDALLLGYAMEGLRLAGASASHRQATSADTITEDDGTRVSIMEGDRVYVDFVSAARDPTHFPAPETVDPRRDPSSYVFHGQVPHACLGQDASKVGLTELFRAVFRRKNVRRVPGPQGELKRVEGPGGFRAYMTEDWGTFTPFPVSMKVTWDD
ncbi:related to linoleate diol synthase [Cephalotrichum gorgonifer]|uniref:Related to linoleate diol synthase n=1 Tax=Cephalotrichum gorgonifer TaxID=2041049 RepID=A0AAE8MS49_9PEZI|nr:related to linoleate diol synthase [Cephalotrichum gorgonifer]